MEEEGEGEEEEEAEEEMEEEGKIVEKKKKKSMRPKNNLKEWDVDNSSDGDSFEQEDMNPHNFIDGLSLSKFRKTKT